ncbi:unnamed protein product, partial [Coregonus sp. 'balchen']
MRAPEPKVARWRQQSLAILKINEVILHSTVRERADQRAQTAAPTCLRVEVDRKLGSGSQLCWTGSNWTQRRAVGLYRDRGGNMTDKRMSRWYFGGLASCGAACCTHPLDLIKVHLQTQQKGKMGMVSMAMQVVKNDGALALYNGLSASLCRQNDVKLPPELRRNYKHAVDGLFRVFREEGVRKLFSGATMASSRGALVTVGQAKQLVLSSGFMGDNILTHFLSSFIAGGCATFLCQPLDVMKTRLMNSKGEYSGLVPAGIRLIPHTVLTFIFLEQLKNNFGIIVNQSPVTATVPHPPLPCAVQSHREVDVVMDCPLCYPTRPSFTCSGNQPITSGKDYEGTAYTCTITALSTGRV